MDLDIDEAGVCVAEPGGDRAQVFAPIDDEAQ